MKHKQTQHLPVSTVIPPISKKVKFLEPKQERATFLEILPMLGTVITIIVAFVTMIIVTQSWVNIVMIIVGVPLSIIIVTVLLFLKEKVSKALQKWVNNGAE